MPIYEFRCSDCGQRTNFFLKSVTGQLNPTCPRCNSVNMVRLISPFAYHKSISTIHEESGEPTMSPNPDYYKDPRNIGRWTEKRMKELGAEMPDSVKEMIQAAREGEMPAPVKELQPGLTQV